VLGNLVLLGIHAFEPIKHDEIITFLAELGVVVLLFQIGLESNITKMKAVGVRAFLVAVVGVIVPFVLGTYLVGPWLLPGLSSNAYLFLGAALTATSVGITARVFKDLRKLQLPEAQIVLGAAVLDDVIGLIILAVVSAIVTVGAVSLGMVGWIAGKAILFLVGAIVVGQLLAPWLGRLLSRVHAGPGMKLTLAISFGLIIAWLANVVGLAPIVGAFAAGLVLDPVHFKRFHEPAVIDEVRASVATADSAVRQRVEQALEHHNQHHVDELVEPLAHFLVPIFFVVTGMGVKLETFADPKIVVVALGVTVAAFVGKLAAGLVAGKCMNKVLVGFGMVPRGEVGLIFAAIGKSLGVVSDSMFSVIVVMVMLTTLITPVILTWLLKRQAPAPSAAIA
jgi:Kef-type K+ transport system membrane component KefB